ncbi:MAG TPA: hypothetical protein PKY87_14645, partial [Terricaulis sp.]|nr:hypothetical protein [Terricaulis sp.]
MDFDFDFSGLKLRHGAGHVSAGVCVMEVVDYVTGADDVTDHPACACPLLTRIAIRLNDAAPSQAYRDRLLPLVPLLAGSRDPDKRAARSWFIGQQVALRSLALKLSELKAPELQALAE